MLRLRVKNGQDVLDIKEIDGKLNISLKLANYNESGIELARLKEIIYIMKKQANYG